MKPIKALIVEENAFMATLLQDLLNQHPATMIETENGTLRVPLSQITFIEGEGSFSSVHLSNNSNEVSSKNIAYFEDILMDKYFFRCHRSFLLNKHHIEALKEDRFILKNGFQGPISRRKKTQATNWFNK